MTGPQTRLIAIKIMHVPGDPPNQGHLLVGRCEANSHCAVARRLASLLPSGQDGRVLHQEFGSLIHNRAQVRFVK